MAKKKQPTKKTITNKSEKSEIKPTKKVAPKKEYKGYIIIDGKSYKVSKAKADECVKRGIAKYL